MAQIHAQRRAPRILDLILHVSATRPRNTSPVKAMRKAADSATSPNKTNERDDEGVVEQRTSPAEARLGSTRRATTHVVYGRRNVLFSSVWRMQPVAAKQLKPRPVRASRADTHEQAEIQQCAAVSTCSRWAGRETKYLTHLGRARSTCSPPLTG